MDSLAKDSLAKDSLAKDWSKITDEELAIAAFGERIPQVRYTEDERPMVITISMDSENTQMPFGQVKTAPFLELFWRKTGADCDGEEEQMKLPDGYTYLISLAAHCE
tara:strand:+ start:203 stop:523 length:321 start_codon:yes stop_codon:yes gene_type:complete